MEIIGKEVVSRNTGSKGIVTDIDNKSLYVNFESRGSIPISFKNVESLLLADEELINYINSFKSKPTPVAKKDTRPHSPSKKKYFFKFEGRTESGENVLGINSVMEQDERLYILNFHNRPSLSYGDEFFIVKSFTDGFNRGQASIYGKGSVEDLADNDYYKEDWLKQLAWLPAHPHYIVVKEFKILNTSLKNGILIKDLVDQIGSDLYQSTQGKELRKDELLNRHNQKSHMYTSKETFEFINKIFEEKAQEYGVTEYKRY